MPAALTIASSSIRPVVSGMTPLSQHPSSKPSGLVGPSDPQRQAEFDEIERLLKEPLPEAAGASPYQIDHHRIRHRKAKRRAAEKRSATIGRPPKTKKYMYSESKWYIEVHSNKSVLVNRRETEYGQFYIHAEVPEPTQFMRNVTDGRAVSKGIKGHEHRVTIQSVMTLFFLCMNARGDIYTSRSKEKECIFLQEHANDSYYYFISARHPEDGKRCKKNRERRRDRRKNARLTRSAGSETCRWFLMVKRKKNSNSYQLGTYKLEGSMDNLKNLRKRKRAGLRFMEWPAEQSPFHTVSSPIFTFPTTPTTPTSSSGGRGNPDRSEFTIRKPTRGGSKKRGKGGCNENNLLSDCRTRKPKQSKKRKGGDFSIGRKSRRKQRKEDKKGGVAGIFNVGPGPGPD